MASFFDASSDASWISLLDGVLFFKRLAVFIDRAGKRVECALTSFLVEPFGPGCECFFDVCHVLHGDSSSAARTRSTRTVEACVRSRTSHPSHRATRS
jgi:hypothetical protein